LISKIREEGSIVEAIKDEGNIVETNAMVEEAALGVLLISWPHAGDVNVRFEIWEPWDDGRVVEQIALASMVLLIFSAPGSTVAPGATLEVLVSLNHPFRCWTSPAPREWFGRSSNTTNAIMSMVGSS
jgi:hypothetical protein